MWIFFSSYIGPYLCNIKAIIRVVEGDIKCSSGMFRKREGYQLQCLAIGQVNMNEALWRYFSS